MLSTSVAVLASTGTFDSALIALLALSLSGRLPTEADQFSGPFPLTRASSVCLGASAVAATAALLAIVLHW